MRRTLWIALSVTVIAGCGTDYRRDISAKSLGEHRFVRVEFKQWGNERRFPHKVNWDRVDGFTLVADDGWRLIILGPGHPGYNRPLDDRNDEPIRYQPGRQDRLWLIDPQGRYHPVAVSLGDLSPTPKHLNDEHKR